MTPLYKGTGSKDDHSNYRPISVISHIPKIIEKFVSFMLNKYLCENSLLKNDQFAYVKYQSTVNVLHTVVDIALNNINNSLLTGIVQLDLRKGFDTINHKILLYKLQKYGINSNCVSWFQSYLNNRKQILPRAQFSAPRCLYYILMILVLLLILLYVYAMLTIHLWLLGAKTLLKFGKNYKLVQIKLYNGYTITGYW